MEEIQSMKAAIADPEKPERAKGFMRAELRWMVKRYVWQKQQI